LISAKALLDRNPAPSRREIAAALDDNICRCGSHNRILRAVERAARVIREGAAR
jgi:nicotinate dehydrogenase subunit A